MHLYLLLLLEIQLAFDVAVQDYMLKDEVVFGKVAPIVFETLLAHPLHFVELVEEFEGVEIERGSLLVLLQYNHLFIHVLPVLVDVLLHYLVHTVYILHSEGNFEVGFVSLILLLGFLFAQSMQL